MNYQRQWIKPGEQIGLSIASVNAFRRLQKYDLKGCSENINMQEKYSEMDGRSIVRYSKQIEAKMRHLTMRKEKRTAENIEDLKIYIEGFWEDFDFNSSIIRFILEKALNCKIFQENNPKDCDFEIRSLFMDNSERKDNSFLFKILFAGENIAPIYNICDFSLSMNLDAYCQRNLYLPLSISRMYDLCVKSNSSNIYEYIEVINNKKWLSRQNKRKNSAIFIGNNDHPIRRTIIDCLYNLGIKTDCYGSHYKPIQDKDSLYSNYDYIICPENSWSPGYTTEKLVDSLFLSDAIPIFWGYCDFEIFNKKKMIYLDPTIDIEQNLRKQILGLRNYYCNKNSSEEKINIDSIRLYLDKTIHLTNKFLNFLK